MNVLNEIAGLSGLRGPLVIAAGVFDGVHLGHSAVLRRALEGAAHLHGEAVALTFDPHPAKVLRPESAPRLITSIRHKLRLIGSLGFHHALVVRFDETMAATTAAGFLAALADAALPLAGIVVGCGWRFGAGRAGTVELIRRTGLERGFEAVEVAAVEHDGLPISSTRIRAAIEAGDLATASACLGRPFEIFGTVVHGRQLGRQLGFPTANLRTHNEQFPPDGVYAGLASGDRLASRSCVINIGVRPTVSDTRERTLEVHIPGYDGDLYDSDMTVVFSRFLRPEKKFDSVEALVEQIRLDAGSVG